MALSAEDCEAIRQLVARYNFAVDLGDAEGWADTFLPEGVFECVGVPEGSPLGGRHQGRAALVAYATTHHRLNGGRARHWNWNLLIEGDGERATLRCYLAALVAGQGDGARLVATGIYTDRLARTAAGWRFASRRIEVDPA
jgi:hypothetical protein